MRRVVDGALAKVHSLVIRHIPPVASVKHAVGVRATAANTEVGHFLPRVEARAVIVDVVELWASLVPPCAAGVRWEGPCTPPSRSRPLDPPVIIVPTESPYPRYE